MRTSWPCLPSGRSAASTSKNASPREPHHLAGQPGGDRVRVLGDEDDVDVADVVQLRARRTCPSRSPRAAASARRRRRPIGSRPSARRPARRRPDPTDARRPCVNGSTGSFSTVGARSKRRQHQQPVAVQRSQTGCSCSRCVRWRFRRDVAAKVARSSSADGSVTAPASRCHESRVRRPGDRRAPATNRAHRTTGPAAPRSLTRACVEFVPVPSRGVGQPDHRRAARRPRRARATATTTARRARRCSSPAGPGPRPRRVRPARAGQRWAASVAASRVWPRI